MVIAGWRAGGRCRVRGTGLLSIPGDQAEGASAPLGQACRGGWVPYPIAAKPRTPMNLILEAAHEKPVMLTSLGRGQGREGGLRSRERARHVPDRTVNHAS